VRDDQNQGEGTTQTGTPTTTAGVTAEEVRAIVREALGTGPAGRRRSAKQDTDDHGADIRAQVLEEVARVREGEREAEKGKAEKALEDRLAALENAGKPPAKEDKVPEVRPNLMTKVTRFMWSGDDD